MLLVVSESLGRSQVVINVARELSLTPSYFANIETLDRLMSGQSRRFVVLGERDISNEVVDSLVVGQEWRGDVRVVLFVKLRAGVELDDELRDRLRRDIREGCSPRHVPQVILAVEDIPYTISGKKVELAVRKVVHNQAVHNQDALKNPEALALYKALPELKN